MVFLVRILRRRGFSSYVNASHRRKRKAVILFLAFAIPICWARYRSPFTGVSLSRPKSDANSIMSVCRMYQINNGFFPTTEQGLQALVTMPSTKPVPEHWTALADCVPKDPWGQEYHYVCDDPFSNDPKVIHIISAGKDGTLHTEDDLNLFETTPLTFRERLKRWLSF